MSRIVAEVMWRLRRESRRLIVALLIIEMLCRTQGWCHKLLQLQLGGAYLAYSGLLRFLGAEH